LSSPDVVVAEVEARLAVAVEAVVVEALEVEALEVEAPA
jgi:hypothetical protein